MFLQAISLRESRRLVDLNTIYMIINMVKSFFFYQENIVVLPYHVMTRIFIIERSNQQYRAAFTQLQAKQMAAVVCIASGTLNRRMT